MQQNILVVNSTKIYWAGQGREGSQGDNSVKIPNMINAPLVGSVILPCKLCIPPDRSRTLEVSFALSIKWAGEQVGSEEFSHWKSLAGAGVPTCTFHESLESLPHRLLGSRYCHAAYRTRYLDMISTLRCTALASRKSNLLSLMSNSPIIIITSLCHPKLDHLAHYYLFTLSTVGFSIVEVP